MIKEVGYLSKGERCNFIFEVKNKNRVVFFGVLKKKC